MSDHRPSIDLARRLRADAIRATTAAGSGHPTSALSMADILAVLATGHLRFDAARPDLPGNDRLILSKGHAAPGLYALLKAMGLVSDAELLTLRRFGSRLQGHPTTELPLVVAATGSLGQGLPVGVGHALGGRRFDHLGYRVWVVLGDSELAEGSVYEAAWAAAHLRLGNLVAILDVNRLGQRGPTVNGWDTGAYRRRFEAFGWRTMEVDGHDHAALDAAFASAARPGDQPVCLVARTVKGQGVSFLADQEGWHGKALDEDEARRALVEIAAPETARVAVAPPPGEPSLPAPAAAPTAAAPTWPSWDRGARIATREAFGAALAALGAQLPGLLVLDAEVGNSTRTDLFKARFPDRFVELFIAEQLMVGVAQGLSWLGRWTVFAATFAAFLSRAHDQLRMAAISRADLRLCGSHAGIEIGEDGPSQMGLEDIAIMRGLAGSTVLYPADANAASRLTRSMAGLHGISYLRTTRGPLPVIYGSEIEFPIGGSKTLRSSTGDRITLIGAGATLHQAIAAADILAAEGISARVIDLYSIKPIDAGILRRAAEQTGHLLVVEDHWAAGGIGEAVLSAVAASGIHCGFTHLAVTGMPGSGPSDVLYDHHGLSSSRIVSAALAALSGHLAHV